MYFHVILFWLLNQNYSVNGNVFKDNVRINDFKRTQLSWMTTSLHYG